MNNNVLRNILSSLQDAQIQILLLNEYFQLAALKILFFQRIA